MLPSEFTSVGEGAGKAKRRGREEIFENSPICSEKKETTQELIYLVDLIFTK